MRRKASSARSRKRCSSIRESLPPPPAIAKAATAKYEAARRREAPRAVARGDVDGQGGAGQARGGGLSEARRVQAALRPDLGRVLRQVPVRGATRAAARD